MEPWNFMTSIQLGISSSQLTKSIIFQRGGEKPPTRYESHDIAKPARATAGPREAGWNWIGASEKTLKDAKAPEGHDLTNE